MSSSSNPISPARFASALEDLPVSALHAKAAEIQNSLHHLVSSNEQLQPFAEDGDVDCVEAIKENELVMERFKERLALLKAEVEGRGMRWVHNEQQTDGDAHLVTTNGTVADGESLPNANGSTGQRSPRVEEAATGQPQSGTLSDDELAARLQQRLTDDDEDDGMHL